MYQKIFLALNKRYPLVILLLYYIGGPIGTCIFCYMPIFASGDLITTHLIDYMANYFKIWGSMFRQKTKETSNAKQHWDLLIQSSADRYTAYIFLKNKKLQWLLLWHFEKTNPIFYSKFIQSQVQSGLALIDLVEGLNTTLQGLISVTIITCLVQSILCIYMASSTTIYNGSHLMFQVQNHI